MPPGQVGMGMSRCMSVGHQCKLPRCSLAKPGIGQPRRGNARCQELQLIYKKKNARCMENLHKITGQNIEPDRAVSSPRGLTAILAWTDEQGLPPCVCSYRAKGNKTATHPSTHKHTRPPMSPTRRRQTDEPTCDASKAVL